MRRIMMLLTVVTTVLVMLAMSVSPAFAKGCGCLSTAYFHSNGHCFKSGG